MNVAKLSAAEARALRTVLNAGGHAACTSGRLSEGAVHTGTLRRLLRAGLVEDVRIEVGEHHVFGGAADEVAPSYKWHLFVTAAGCAALNAYEARQGA